jgi:hypothetical protein
MNENDELLTSVPEQDSVEVIDLDDVEGHGLKEVAAGLGAAALLAGGGAAAAASTGAASVSVHPSGVTISTGTVLSDPVGTVDRTSDQAITEVRSVRDAAVAAAGNLASQTVTRAGTTVASTEHTATQAIEPTVALAKSDVAAAGQIAANAANWTTSTTQTAISPTMRTTQSTAGSAVRTAGNVANAATNAASNTVREADRKVATVLSVITSTTANGVHTATATLKAVNAGAGVDAQNAGGWILVKAGDAVLAQVHLTGGTATASWTAPVVGGHSVTVSYTGDNIFAPSLRTIAL